MTKVILQLIVVVTLLQGCANGAFERDGTSVDITPVYYTLKVSDQPDMAVKVDQFATQYWQMIAHNGVTIRYSDNKRKALQLKARLISQGIKAEDIRLDNTDLGRFSMMLEVVEYHTQVEFCQYPSIGAFSAESYGCFVQNARWQSMTHPRRNVPSTESQR